MALREARNSGIYPFCITVDQKAPEYIEKMFGDVRYTIIQNINTLPEKLPRIYKALTT
jgi:nitric oxide reductase activation protein